MTKLELILICSNGLFLTLWLWAARLLGREMKIALIRRDLITKICHLYDDAQLAKLTLETTKNQLEAQQEMIASMKIIGDRLASYNERVNTLTERVNHLTTAVYSVGEQSKPNTLKN